MKKIGHIVLLTMSNHPISSLLGNGTFCHCVANILQNDDDDDNDGVWLLSLLKIGIMYTIERGEAIEDEYYISYITNTAHNTIKTSHIGNL